MVIQVKNNIKPVLPISNNIHEGLNMGAKTFIGAETFRKQRSLKWCMTYSSSDYFFVALGFELNTSTLSHSNNLFW
jgi:hypothetical protein